MAAPLVHQVNVKATPEQIYAAVSTANGLGAFWTSDSQADHALAAFRSRRYARP